jgi:plastocyanin
VNKKILLILIGFSLVAGSASALASDLAGKVSAQGLRKSENILVYLTKTPGFSGPPQNTFAVDQNNLTFLPHVLVIPKGATVSFPNSDKVDHNVFSLSRTKKFNFGSYKPGQSHDVVFDKPGIVGLRCDVHAEMIAYILVMKSPYYALTDKKGNFKIDTTGLSPGKYTLKTWHEKLKNSRMTIDLTESIKTPLTIKLKRGTPGVLYK